MKYKFLIIIFLLLAEGSFGQTIKNIFFDLPVLGLTEDEKELMIENYLSGKKGREYGVGGSKDYLIQYQPSNGFLAILGAYEGSVSLTYWNISNGNKLIGILHSSCGGACDSHLGFYLKTSEGISELPLHEVIPEITMADFFDTEQMKKDGITKPITNKDFLDFYNFLYSLPGKGKNITVESQTHELGEIPDKYKKYDLGPEITLIWNDGTFIKQ